MRYRQNERFLFYARCPAMELKLNYRGPGPLRKYSDRISQPSSLTQNCSDTQKSQSPPTQHSLSQEYQKPFESTGQHTIIYCHGITQTQKNQQPDHRDILHALEYTKYVETYYGDNNWRIQQSFISDKIKGQNHNRIVGSTYNWYWLVDGLMAAGYVDIHLANPSAIKQYKGLKYTDDQHDAFWLAKLLALGILSEGYIYSKESRPVRDLLRRRSFLVKHRTSYIHSLQSMIERYTSLRVSGNDLKKLEIEDLQKTFKEEWVPRRSGRSYWGYTLSYLWDSLLLSRHAKVPL